ncbi:MAG TPA: ABC transporter permease subunit [Chloroflexota bacterium]|nr:ABC transporter permease subunit [Chloroflexota bacterium]HZU05067.1 ABC transporter permease subunit [Chloroflexota bacterium]
MPGLLPVFRKELADHFNSRRFIILFLLVLVSGLGAAYVAAQSIREELGRASEMPVSVFLLLFTASNGTLPAFITFIGFLGPLVGLALGFDAINSEQARGTLSRLLAQPIYRDSVINGKFLAGLATIAVMLTAITLLATGLGLPLIGRPPGPEEIARLVLFIVLSVVYVAFWMAVAIFFSIVFRQTATAALASIALWIVCAFFVGMLAGVAADLIAPLGQDPAPAQVLRNDELRRAIARISPTRLYAEAVGIIMNPSRNMLSDLVLASEVRGMVPGTLPLLQSLLLVWPQVTGLIALTCICFAASYIRFMRQEIRA